MTYSLKHIEGELCRRSFYEFVIRAWPTIRPGTVFTDGKHIRAICDHLEALWRGDIRNLLIAVPPRHMKSLLTSVLWPAWVWCHKPSIQFLCASYGADLAVRNNLDMRRLVTSDWYRQTMIDTLPDNDPRHFVMMSDQNAKEKFENSSFGSMQAISVGSKVTGFNCDILIVDDAVNASEYQSEAALEEVKQWWASAVSNRKNNPKDARRVVIGQRVSERDLIGMLHKQGGWEYLMLPAELELERKCKTKIGFEDWRTEEGELLWPERVGPQELIEMKADYLWDKYMISAQLQQNPTPAEGGLFKKEYWQTWAGPMPEFVAIIQSWDTALETKTHNDYSVCTTWGIFTHSDVLGEEWGKKKGTEYTRYCMMLLECVEKRLEGPDLREEAVRLYKTRNPDFLLVERKASGHGLIQELRRTGINVIPFDPKGNDKMARANVAAIMWQQGCIYVPDKEWVKKVIAQHTVFPNGDFDDIVDSCVQAALFTRRKFWVTLSGEWDDDDSPPEPKVLRGFYD